MMEKIGNMITIVIGVMVCMFLTFLFLSTFYLVYSQWEKNDVLKYIAENCPKEQAPLIEMPTEKPHVVF